MYRSFRAKNFRCFTDLNLQDLARINLIAGMNNVGKTALLEALLIHGSVQNPKVALALDGLRGLSYASGSPESKAPWGSLFGGFEESVPLELLGERESGGERLVRLRLLGDPAELVKVAPWFRGEFPEPALSQALGVGLPVLAVDYEENGRGVGTSYLFYGKMSMYQALPPLPLAPPFIYLAARGLVEAAECAERYGKMEVIGQQDMVRDALRVIEPSLRRAAVVVVGGSPVIHANIGLDRLMPLPLMGEGMTRLFNLVVAIGNAPKGVVLVDEIENGLHHSVLQRVWRVIAEAARQFDVQVFATTHSFECIEAAHRAFDEDLGFEYDFRLHRLERVNGDIVAKTYDRETMQGALQLGVEVR